MDDDGLYRIQAPTGNYYGRTAVWAQGGKYFIGTENYSGWDSHEISKDFFDAWVKEFAIMIAERNMDDLPDDDNEAFDDFDELMQECGLGHDGQCSMAGTEHCDFTCPMRDSEDFCGSKAWNEKHKEEKP